MSFLSNLFGGSDSASGLDVESAVITLSALYDDPEVVSERGIAINGRRAEEVRALGRQLHKGGGKERMLAARDRFREKHNWAGANLETIWSSIPEWQK
ncbi:MAG: hypothetical protein LC797_21370 [Chloroflexi bacterium]|nr:hypothetical protein [Chloroflexota bacterium]